jgi:hypothetical protein
MKMMKTIVMSLTMMRLAKNTGWLAVVHDGHGRK